MLAFCSDVVSGCVGAAVGSSGADGSGDLTKVGIGGVAGISLSLWAFCTALPESSFGMELM